MEGGSHVCHAWREDDENLAAAATAPFALRIDGGGGSTA